MGDSSPWTSPMWVLPMSYCSSQAAPAWVPSTGCSPSRNWLLQCGSPTGSRVLPASQLHSGLLCPWRHRSRQESAPVWASQGDVVFFRSPLALLWCLPWAAGRSLLHHGPPWAAGAHSSSPWAASGATGESLLLCLEHLLLLLLYWPWCLQSCFSHIF